MEKLPLNIHTTSRILEDYEQGWTLQGSSEWMALDPRNQGRKAVVNFWILSHDPLSVAGNLRAMNERYHEVAFVPDSGDPLETVVRKKLKSLTSRCIDLR